MNFIKHKPLKIEAYTFNGKLLELFPPVKAIDMTPDWYNQLPTHSFVQGLKQRELNVRQCSGFKDLFNLGIMLPSWTDFNITVMPDKRIDVQAAIQNDGNIPAGGHSLEHQAAGAWPGYVNVKLHSPWFFKTNKMVKWLAVTPTWNMNDPLEWTQPTGILEFKHQHQTNVNGLFKLRDRPYTVKIKAGQALTQYIPLIDEPWELEVKFLEQDDYKKYFTPWNFSFDMVYQKTRHLLEKRK